MSITTPDWVKHAVFYQIFPDRFARSNRANHPPGITFKPWGSPPDEQGFQGGDLYGIVDKLDYLQDLGITALYLNPIFASAANHRYHPYDYFSVDTLLGGDEALRELLDEAHKREIRVILDGVFNHASRGFWPFHHVLECGENSPYVDWFHIKGWPLNPYPRAKKNVKDKKKKKKKITKKKQELNYAAWWDLPALPKLNTDNPGVREYIMRVARHWTEFGIDGWRLDVPEEIDDDSFWQEFRDTVKSINPEAYICGEIWHEAQRWLQGDQFDAVMNYVFTNAAISFFGTETLRDYKVPDLQFDIVDAPSFAKEIDRMHELYDWQINQVQLNLLDSHDTARALWIMGDDKSALRLCALFQMTMPGAPCIYYGDEIGMSSRSDPFCREAFPWNDEDRWDKELLDFYRRATALRHKYPVLRTGTFAPLHAENNIYAFQRENENQTAVVLFNRSQNGLKVEIEVPGVDSLKLVEAWPDSEEQHEVTQEKLVITVPPREARVLVSHDQP